MPGFLLTASDPVQCLHAGKAQATVPGTRVLIGKQPVVTQASAYMVAACPFNVSGAPSPCLSVLWTVVATRVMTNKVPVLLQDSQASCAPNGTGVLATPTNARVKGI
jgi:hypothetical protein